MSAPPMLSVVVCTHDRSSDLARCLRALAALEDPVEVIVVDSASTPPITENALVRAALAALSDATTARVEATGLSRARNEGTVLARCPIVAFIDDDAFVRPDWARRILQPFSRTDVVCVGGSCAPVFEATRPRWLSDRLLQFAGATRLGTEPRPALHSRELPFGANMAFRRKALIEIGGFDETLGRNGSSLLSGEESAVMEKLVAAGLTVWLQPDAVVDHLIQKRRTESGWYWSRMWWAGVGRARGPQSRTTLARMCLAAPVRAGAWIATRDRVYLYRLAESAGYIVERAQRGLFASRARKAPA